MSLYLPLDPTSVKIFALGILFSAGVALVIWSLIRPRQRKAALIAKKRPRVRRRPRSTKPKPVDLPVNNPSPDPSLNALWESLTEQEQRVAALLEEGLTNKEIADRLVIEVSTVESHCSAIYGKLHVRRRSQVGKLMRAQGWTPGQGHRSHEK